MALNTFQPQGATSMIALTTAASAAIQPSTGSIQGVKIANLSTNDAYVTFGVTTATAVYPTTTTAGLGQPILQRSVETFVFPPNGWLSALTSSGAALLAVTPGYGQ